MTKLYEGTGIYTVYLSSNKKLELTEDEMNEIAEESGAVEDLQAEIIDTKTELDSILLDIEEQGQYIREVENLIPELDRCIDFIKKESSKEEYRNLINRLESAIGELDSLCKYI